MSEEEIENKPDEAIQFLEEAVADKRNKKYSAIWFEEIPVTIFLDWEVIHPKNDDDCFTFLHYPTRLFWTSPPVSSAVWCLSAYASLNGLVIRLLRSSFV